MEIKTLIDIVIEDKIHLIVSLFTFFIELTIIYVLYLIIFKLIDNISGKKISNLGKNILKVAFISMALYSLDLTGFPISRILVDTGILWVIAVTFSIFLFYRITIAIENRLKLS